MRKRFLFLIINLLLSLCIWADDYVQPLWVGETYMCDLRNVSSIEYPNPDWVINDTVENFLSIQKNGVTCLVTVKKYFSGSLIVLSSWDYIPFPDLPTYTERMYLSWYFSCKENPVSISPTSMTLAVGQQGQVNYSHQYSNNYSTTANAGIYYTCTPTGVVSVSSTGKVTALKAGTAKVYVHSNLSNDANAPYCTVTVNSPTVELPKTMTIRVGQSIMITPLQSPGSGYTLTWRSSNTAIATVSSSGLVTGKKVGTARITATVSGTNQSDYCDVTVKDILLGDVNDDGTVSISDVTTLIDLLLNSGSYYNAAADMNQDDKVSIADVTELIDYLLNGGGKLGDVNNDGHVTIDDVTALINYLLGGNTIINTRNADMNRDGQVNIADVTALINYLLSNNKICCELDVNWDKNGQIEIYDIIALIPVLKNYVFCNK